ncbi:MAG TPA: YdeI/OmpD-associated family protein [Pyrinomonadaceae bacterium]|nr:YdeI/OmpD-associated family protein [Pyrinomonadaceae bacterium]
MAKVELTVKLEAVENSKVVPRFTLPKKESAKFGTRARVAVAGTINGFPFRSSIFPTGTGTHYMAINREMRAGANVKIGDRVKITLETDTEPRTVEVPADLKKALSKSKPAHTRFEKLSYTHRKEYVQWVEGAKRQETRACRIEEVIKRLSS